MSVSDRIQQLLDHFGWSKAELARQANTSRQAVNGWMNNKVPSQKAAIALREKHSINDAWLTQGRGQMITRETISEPTGTYNVAAVAVQPRPVPLISWAQACEHGEAMNDFDNNKVEEWLGSVSAHSKNTYALRVVGDSMTAAHGLTFPDGCIIYVDPDAAGTVQSGDIVVAKINGNSELTFKQFICDAGRQFLKPLNNQYPSLHDPFHVVGKVVGKWEFL